MRENGMVMLDSGKRAERTESPASPDQKPAIEISGLVKAYGGHRAVNGLSLAIAPGEVFGLLGPNGAGKTTTVECLVGLREPTEGGIEVLGLDPLRDRGEFVRRVSVQPQEASLFPTLTVEETLRLWASLHARPRGVADTLERIGLREQAGVKAKALSGGQRRRLLLGVAVIANPEVLVLDEPAAGLDPQARQQLWDLIRAERVEGTTVLLTTHDMTEATELCDRVGIVVGGRLVALGTPRELVHRLGVAHEVSFETEADLTEIEALDCVSGVSVDGSRATVTTSDTDEVVRAVAGLSARHIEVRTGRLEDVFLKLAAEHHESTAAERNGASR
ncbi:multidrug ABC transporter ATP-binding protein [Planobispora takensis]|uniref:Multidrug ABC transporter ATP-binding protein n=2 Tax=Planobispora takensis TaxID=1367882 RepID=A0A8J3SZ82_9ACTN|nr:multidrug ABC transporter ATP-binding protein [Planobispora takensis]